MAYGDKIEFRVGNVRNQEYEDGTVLPSLRAEVWRNGVWSGYVVLHAHRTKNPPHGSIGVTVRVGDEEQIIKNG